MPGGNWRQVENRDRMYRFSSSYSSSRLSAQAFDFRELTICSSFSDVKECLFYLWNMFYDVLSMKIKLCTYINKYY